MHVNELVKRNEIIHGSSGCCQEDILSQMRQVGERLDKGNDERRISSD